MGLFSTEKQVSVASVVYNLAGPPSHRTKYLKTALMSAVFNPTKAGIGESVTKSLLNGPGINLRSFGRWARNSGYTTLAGQTNGTFTLPINIDQDALAPLLPHDLGQVVSLQTSTIGVADFTYWAHRYMVANHPTLVDTDYTVALNTDTNTVTITFAGGGGTESFVASDYDVGAMYLYATYNRVTGYTEGSVVTGSTIELDSGGDLPDILGWTVDTSYAADDGMYDVYVREIYQGWVDSANGTATLREWMIQFSPDDGLDPPYSYRIDTQLLIHQSWFPLEVFIYKEGSGIPALDAFFASSSDAGGFLPYIPIRIDNAFISGSYHGDLFPEAKKALRKSVHGNLTDLITKVGENPNLADIDYAYVVFGVSLNAAENDSKRYLYEFFQEIMLGQDLSGASFLSWQTAHNAAVAAQATWQAWAAAQSIETDPLYNTAMPPEPVYPPPPHFEVRIRSGGRPSINYDMIISWNSIAEFTGSGLLKPDAKAGDLWWEVVPREIIAVNVSSTTEGGSPLTFENEYGLSHVKLHWQTSATTWRTLEFWGLTHQNLIYRGSSVIIYADDAVNDEDESGFIIPLHEAVLRSMPLRRSTQISLSCAYLVFNCYKVVKSKWYESTWFKIVLMVAMVIIAAATGYIDPNSAGLLGANSAVGASMGLTGAAAAMAGAVANAMVASMIIQIIGLAATSVAGAKWGAIISTVLTVAMMTVQISGGATPGSTEISTTFSTLLEAPNLIKLTLSIGNVIKEITNEGTQDILRKTQSLINDYTAKSKEVQSLMEILEGGADVMNPLELTDYAAPNIGEPVDTFFSRTLMTGSDIAELSQSLISDFSEITLRSEPTI